MRGGRASPCIGICSTTYGDLVCRGCHRFAHEVVQWNAYDEQQRGAIRRRLEELRDGSLASFLSAERVRSLCALAGSVKLHEGAWASDASLAYEVLRRLAMRRLPLPWAQCEGTGTVTVGTDERRSARDLLSGIDREVHNRSRAAYERSYRIPAD